MGQGKSRLLKVLAICNKSLSTSANSSIAPIMSMNRFGSTVIIDEAELYKTSDKMEEIKEVLRHGTEKSSSVLRCDNKDFENVRDYHVFWSQNFRIKKCFK